MIPIQHADLNRQVTKLIKKGLVREGMSPCVVPALLTPKKDNTWRMCTDSKAINKITIKYLFPITCLDNMMDVCYTSKLLTLIVSQVSSLRVL
jgi:hypothetical protein